MQDWDLSCGAAALATVLTYQHGDPVSEREVLEGLIDRAEYLKNPNVVRARMGFSFLDLKRFAEGRGYVGRGLSQLDFQHVAEMAPMIIPVEIHGYRHFVVFRGMKGKSVLLADPAYGNRTMSKERFEEIWKPRGELGRVGLVVEKADGRDPPNRMAADAHDFMIGP